MITYQIIYSIYRNNNQYIWLWNIYSKSLYFPCKEIESIIVDREKRHLPIHGKNKRMCKFSSFLLLFNINTGPIICQEQSDMLKAKWKGREIISCYWTYPFVSKRVVLITRYILLDTLNESKEDDCWMAFNNIVSYNKTYLFWYSESSKNEYRA